MPRKLIRLPLGINYSNELFSGLKEFLKSTDDDIIEYYSPKPNYEAGYKDRVQSIGEAFHLILDAYPLQIPALGPKLKEYEQKLCKQYHDAKSLEINPRVTFMQDKLKTYTNGLVSALMEVFRWNKETATEHLNKSEQYNLMLTERKEIITLVPINDQIFALEWERAFPKRHLQTDKEVRFLKKIHCPLSPDWYYKLSSGEQYYISCIGENKNILEDLNKFNDQWSEIKTNRGQSLAQDFLNISKYYDNDESSLPHWFKKLPLHHQALIQSYEMEASKNIQIFKNILEKDSGETELIQKLPFWYACLSPFQQHILGHVIEKHPNGMLISYSRDRDTLPIAVNTRTHISAIIDVNGNITNRTPNQYASAHLVPRDLLAAPKNPYLLQQHIDNNLEQVLDVIGDKIGLIGTLISPIGELYQPTEKIFNYVVAYLGLPPDLVLHRLLEKSLQLNSRKSKPLFTNHPLNEVAIVNPTRKDNINSKTIIELVKKYIETASPVEQEFLNDAIKAYESVLKGEHPEDRNRELFLASYEKILIMFIGGVTHGTCVSAKDRKAIEFIMIAAILNYYVLYKKFPRYDDCSKDRENLVEIIAKHHLSGHHQTHSAQNGRGTPALKSPGRYWSPDVRARIIELSDNANALIEEDRVASNNELDKIVSKPPKFDQMQSMIDAVFSSITDELGESYCQEIIDKLVFVLAEREQRFQCEVKTLFGAKIRKVVPEINSIWNNIHGLNDSHIQNSNKTVKEIIKEVMLICYHWELEKDPTIKYNDVTIQVFNIIEGFYTTLQTQNIKTENIKKLETLSTLLKGISDTENHPLPPNDNGCSLEFSPRPVFIKA